MEQHSNVGTHSNMLLNIARTDHTNKQISNWSGWPSGLGCPLAVEAILVDLQSVPIILIGRGYMYGLSKKS